MKLKIVWGSFLLIIIALYYLYNTYSSTKYAIQTNSKQEIILLYELYKKMYHSSKQTFNIENPNFIDNKELIDQLVKSTPFIVNKEEKTIPQFHLEIEIFSTLSNHEIVTKYAPSVYHKNYTVEVSEKNIVLFGKIEPQKYIYIKKPNENKELLENFLGNLEILTLYIILNIFLMFYYIVSVKQNKDEKEFMENHFKILEEDTRKLAFEDKLTGAATRLKFDESLKDLIELANRFEEYRFSLAILDIDNFKRVNDTFGHDYGDIVLQKVAQTVKSHIRKSDIFARWGGEEFVILLPMTKLEGGIGYIERIREDISSIKFDKLEQVTCSFGFVEYKKNDTETTILKRADENLYHAKKNGKNKVVYNIY